MPPRLTVEPSSAIPIWRQIEAGVRRMVAAGVLAPGDAVPSVRELARELVINPATVAKAYQRLVDDGVLAVRRGEGTFVAERPPAALEAERSELLGEAAGRYTRLAAGLGATRNEAVRRIEEMWPATDEEVTNG